MPRNRVPSQAVFALVAAVSITNADALDLKVAAGETYTVTPAQQNLVLDKLTIGDGAEIRFAEGVSYWQVVAKTANIGNKVVVNARGSSGATAAAQPAKHVTACESPKSGATGLSGADGGDGLNLTLRFDQASIVGLTLDARGGVGGAGGQGGPGSSAADCEEGDGGQGGSGGRGGEGGHGGHVVLEMGAPSETWEQLSRAVKARIEAGKGGAGGDPGLPGAAAPGRYINKKTLTGSRKWVAGGAEGEPGKPGVSGVSGRDGTAMVRPLVASMAQSGPTMHKTEPLIDSKLSKSNKRTESDHIREMQIELRALRQRIEQLEQKFLQQSQNH